MKAGYLAVLLATALGGLAPVAAFAQAPNSAMVEPANRIERLDVSQQGGSIYLRVALKTAPAAPPASFSVANPARIAFDFPGTGNGLGRNQQNIEQGDLRSANIVQVGDRTRLVLNLVKVLPYETRVEGNSVVIALSPVQKDVAASSSNPSAPVFSSFSETKTQAAAAEPKSIRDITFRRGKDGEGRIVVDLSNPDTAIDIQRRGPNLVVDFIKTGLPEHLRKKSDVTDFGTPITSMAVQTQGDTTRLVVTPSGQWEHNAYQTDNQFVLEVKKLVEDPNKLVQGSRGQFQGEKLSLNFQDVDVRSVLQVIADFTNFNIITSDTVKGNLTLRLKDVPWDQALDIILQAKGLDMRKNGNVIWIAPRDELAAREKLQLESRAQIGDLEPLQTESFQINYHKAKEIFDFLKSKDQTMLSKRGSVVVDERSNKVFVTDVATRLQDLRKLITEIDIPPRQVLIESRIVEAEKGFTRDLGVKLGFNKFNPNGISPGGGRVQIGGTSYGTAYRTGQIFVQDPTNPGDALPLITPDFTNVNLPATPASGLTPGSLALTLFNKSMTTFLNLELTALEQDNRGRIISSPRVMTANQVEALIEQGTEIPYQQSTSSGATSVAYKKAVLSLKVKPQITPDGRVQLYVEVHKDRPGQIVPGGVAIDTKQVTTQVLVDNGGTVVIGGIYEETENNTVDQVPLLGDLPVIGHLFKSTQKVSNRKELMVFITPRIVADALTLR
jgi:type IV pilus assembly protein PilQ